MTLATTAEILADFKAGKMVILIDEEDRENEGDLVLAADFVTPEAINFMARHARGLICLTLTEARCRELRLPLMTPINGARTGTNFTLSIEAAEGVTTGISAADRARTVQVAVAPDSRPEDLVQPGHVFPVMARDGGVLMRAGHTEAGCDLGLLAGLTPAAVICEIMKDDGTMARLPDLVEFGERHGLRIGTIADLIQHRSSTESLVERLQRTAVRTHHGSFDLVAYRDKPGGHPHLALVHGTVDGDVEALVRVHEPLSMLDLLLVGDQSHSWSIDASMRRIVEHGHGVLILLNCAESAQALLARAGALRPDGDGARPAEDGASGTAAAAAAQAAQARAAKVDLRTYGVGAQILKDLGVRRMRLLSKPRRMPSMTGFDLEVIGFEEEKR
ncbi:MAG: bifunctional 3,4-dihydroxy-2-butanone-4-phosphate synthase/GTP cyclohydrolase II [Lautropia sp.]